MKVTVCELCRKQGGNPCVLEKWAQISFAEGALANFLKRPNRKIELCVDCFDKLTNIKDITKEV